MYRGTIGFLPDGDINEVGEELGWLAVVYKDGKHKHWLPWQRGSAAGTMHVVGVRCTKINAIQWELDSDAEHQWFNRFVDLADIEPIKTENLKPRPAGLARTGVNAEFDDYYDQEMLDEEKAKEEKAEAKEEKAEAKAEKLAIKEATSIHPAKDKQ